MSGQRKLDGTNLSLVLTLVVLIVLGIVNFELFNIVVMYLSLGMGAIISVVLIAMGGYRVYDFIMPNTKEDE